MPQSLPPTTDSPVSNEVIAPAVRRAIRAQGLSPDADPDAMISLTAAAAEYGVHPRTLRRAASAGLLPAFRLGSRIIRVRRGDVTKLLTRIPTAS